MVLILYFTLKWPLEVLKMSISIFSFEMIIDFFSLFSILGESPRVNFFPIFLKSISSMVFGGSPLFFSGQLNNAYGPTKWGALFAILD